LIASQTLAAFHICKALKDKGLLTAEEASAAMVATADGLRSAGDKSDKIHAKNEIAATPFGDGGGHDQT
jgi:hypothetical protein